MTSDKVDNLMINHFNAKIRRIRYGFLDTNDLLIVPSGNLLDNSLKNV